MNFSIQFPESTQLAAFWKCFSACHICWETLIAMRTKTGHQTVRLTATGAQFDSWLVHATALFARRLIMSYCSQWAGVFSHLSYNVSGKMTAIPVRWFLRVMKKKRNWFIWLKTFNKAPLMWYNKTVMGTIYIELWLQLFHTFWLCGRWRFLYNSFFSVGHNKS